jgi:hypothetical protein
MALPTPGVLCSCTRVGRLRRARVAVGHQHGHRLLQRQHVPHFRVLAERVQEPLLDGPGVAEHVVHAVGEQLLEDREATRLLGRAPLGMAADRKLPLRQRGA